ncbi:hypothetical protein O6H91_05G122400 [Diphasiastrum complanatum]|nr:hypothetical protein O6H91_05G122400 [Diphasiastrum complanatum]
MLPYLVKLDLSSNHLRGPIPSSLANCIYLNSLHLQKNNLTGSIPGQIGLLDRMKDVDFSDNQLTGVIPYTFANFSGQSFQGNRGLCGTPLSSRCKSPGSGTNAGLVAGVVVGVVLASLAVASLCIWLILFKKRRGRSFTMSGENSWVRKIKAPRAIPVSMFEKPLVKIRLSDLMAATNNFSRDNLIGIGRTGIFYKATLRDGSVLAIKRLRPSPHNDRQFRAEMETLGKVRHRNLVPLLGFCVAGAERLLVYKHMINGTLQTRLHESDEAESLDWPARLKIGIGAARGLAWLHHSCNPRIIHRNISSSSILLDEDFDARITDFGLARLMNPVDTHISTFVNGDFGDVGYVAPEYTRTLVATVKGDVYSFGVALLELVTGQNPVDVNVEGDFKGTLVEWVGMLSNNGKFNEAIDKSLKSKGTDNELVQFLRVGCACVLSMPRDRPSMYEVLQLLRAIGEKYHFTDQDEEVPIVSQTVDIDADELIVTSQGNSRD